MSLSTIYSRAKLGIQAPLVQVETHLSGGLPKFSIVGLPEAAVKESRDRVRSTLINLNFDFPMLRITVNLFPADLPKEGGRFDLPIALGILAASRQIPTLELEEYEIVGELTLSGEIKAIQGILPVALASKQTNRSLIVPKDNADEASLIDGLSFLPVHHILEVCEHFLCKKRLEFHAPKPIIPVSKETVDFSDIEGQLYAKRALEIAAAGGHNVLLIGPPGTGKTMLASRFNTILPSMTEQEATESAAVHSISYKGFNLREWKKRPYRAPHHSASSVALVGGGNPPRPGEISLAHRGVLFLDELAEFNRHVLEALREPLESGVITISRAACQSEFPARFQLIAAMNPCPCGYYGDSEQTCRCTQDKIRSYRSRISGPLLDRFDMCIAVKRIGWKQFSADCCTVKSETSAYIQKRVESAFQRQMQRANKKNSELSTAEIKSYVSLNSEIKQLLQQAFKQLRLSVRGYHRLLRVALTIADLENKNQLEPTHISEALQFRKFEEFF